LTDAGNEKSREAGSPRRSEGTPRGPIRLQVPQLLQGSREAILEHAGQDYRLRITANGKLILTK
jgi:hemin uptake protein HemP